MPEFINQDLPVSSIKPSLHPRQFRESEIEGFARSIQAHGLMAPIVVGEGNQLIAGQRRLLAAKTLGWKTIACRVTNSDNGEAELACLAENLHREDYTEVERLQALARYRELFDAYHTREVGGRGRKVGDNLSPTFQGVAAIASITGQTERTVQRDLAIGESLDEEAAAIIAPTPSGDNKQELAALASLPPEEQRDVAAKVVNGEAPSVRAQVPSAAKPPRSGSTKPGRRIWSEIDGYLGHALNRCDDLNRQFPHEVMHRRFLAQVKLAMDTAKEWERVTKGQK